MSDAVVAILMGSASDWDTMQHASKTLDDLGVPHVARAISAHRTPDAVESFVRESEAAGVRVFIAAAGGAAHLAGVVASRTVRPVLGVPMKAWSLEGLDSLLSTVQMPAGVPVGTLAIGKAGAVNAALLATAILGVADDSWHETMQKDRATRAAKVLEKADVRGG